MGFREYLKKRKRKKFHKEYKVGLCLSGGGARGFVYIGAFKAFEEMGIKFDAVAGASVGSLFGAFYASGMSADEIYSVTKDAKDRDFRKAKLGFLPSKMDTMKDNIKDIIGNKKIEDLSIPYYAVAVDLRTGQEVCFDHGELATIITGSCAIPGVFVPVKYRGMVLIDGGVVNNVPSDVLKMKGCDFIVTIDCHANRGGGTPSNNLITQFVTSVGIMMANNSKNGLDLSDLVIYPNTDKFSSLKIVDREEMIKAGYNATMQMKEELDKLFSGKYKKR